jgi:hypothetical protein
MYSLNKSTKNPPNANIGHTASGIAENGLVTPENDIAQKMACVIRLQLDVFAVPDYRRDDKQLVFPWPMLIHLSISRYKSRAKKY